MKEYSVLHALSFTWVGAHNVAAYSTTVSNISLYFCNKDEDIDCAWFKRVSLTFFNVV